MVETGTTCGAVGLPTVALLPTGPTGRTIVAIRAGGLPAAVGLVSYILALIQACIPEIALTLLLRSWNGYGGGGLNAVFLL